MRRTALALALTAGCASSHGPDSGIDAGSIEPTMCVVPTGGHCCCDYDHVMDPTCTAEGTWTCDSPALYWTGDVCGDYSECGRPCSLPCPPLEVDCAALPPVFPSFERGCTTDAECAAVLHQIDCCGTQRSMGVRADELAYFDDAESLCRTQYLDCGCDASPTEADDGTTGSGDPVVRCVDGACTTAFPADG